MALNPNLRRLREEGVSIWLDTLSREMLETGEFAELIDANLRGLGRRADAGEPVDTIASAASFFLSRIDTKIDERLEADSPAHGEVALASARLAYQHYRPVFAAQPGSGSVTLAPCRSGRCGRARGTKNPSYSDVRYVAELIGPDVINTMPEHTLRAFADHGAVAAAVVS